MNKKILYATTIGLFAIGIGSGSLLFYDYFSNGQNKVELISKGDAFDIAIKAGNWKQTQLEGKTIDQKLLQKYEIYLVFVLF